MSGERCNPHPHNFSDRMIRPGEQAFFDIMHSYNGYRTCYYRCFAVGRATEPQIDAYKRAREWIDVAIDMIKPGVSTDQVARLWPAAQEIGLADEKTAFGLEFGHGLGLALHERPIISRLTSLDAPLEIKEGMVFALETYCPATDGHSAARIEEEVVVGPNGVDDPDQVPGPGPLRHQSLLTRGEAITCRKWTLHTRGHNALEMYRKMTEIRQFEKRAYDLFLQNLVKGTTHLGTGQEAVAAGVSQAMTADDYVFTTYRGHNHVLARGTPMTPVMAELLGRENGLMHGKGGSMHLLDVSRGILGAYAIIGAQLVIANGAAWSAMYRGTNQVTVCFLGDGATNIGAFHEALNLAAVWHLPVVFICENNQYMEYTAIGMVTAVPRPAADRAASYGLEAVVVDGNDVEAVYQTAAAAIGPGRDGGGPALIEALTYRHGGHSRADPGKYRPDDEVKAWLARDPLPAYRQVLIGRGVDEATLDAIDKNARDAVDRATEEAKAGPEPSVEVAATNVWADGGHAWRN